MHSTARHAAIALLVLACACSKSSAPAGPAAPADPVPAAGSVGTLKGLSAGDRACYVVIATDTGDDRSNEGDFALCAGGERDASALIGQRVTWTTEKANVTAAACEGNPDCGQSDEVDLVTTITAAP